MTRRVDLGFGHMPVAQRKGEIVVDGHRVVDDRELEHLGDVALLRRQMGDVGSVEENAPFGRVDQPRNDVEQRGLAAAGGPEQSVGATVVPLVMHFLQRVVRFRFGPGAVGVADVFEIDACMVSSPTPFPQAVPPTALPSGPKAMRWRVSTKTLSVASGSIS